MSTNEERREAAKRKLEERLEREHQAARKRKIVIGSVSGVVVVAIVAVATYFIVDKIQTDRFNAAHVTCDYTKVPSRFDQINTEVPEQITDPAQRKLYQEQIDKLLAGKGKQKTSPEPDATQAKDGTSTLTVDTTQGVIPIELNRSGAPCNTGAVISLADNKYYDGTTCHRMTTAELKVLQCGDPTGTGAGGPGWTSPDEPPTNLKSAGDANPMTGQQPVIYPRGTVAIANSGQAQQGESNSGGAAQFFVMIQDSTLPASYAVVGHVEPAGMEIVDKVFKGGINPGLTTNQTTGAIEPATSDGTPKLPVTINSATVS
ncbi:peptidylprolyl isomerase [Gordonia desulfuricans]|uniref:Peptidylprolyl isomerase n=1 Tax=Gordonia desulfuricans TaxID=89051 RepID=A0A7K3LV07_9ACTN|nr:peptidylprolyl isomerase [Gordonia desulfuricans]NDK92039.1 peptidylprolyl isomerase [Gordonia desulfuricans]